MAGGAGGGEEDAIYDINVTPLVDITLVLLIIMMVTAKMIASEYPPVDLPKAVSGEEVEKDFSVAIEGDGTFYVEERKLPSEKELLEAAKKAYENNKEVRAVLRADQDVEHGKVIETLETLKRARIGRIAFAVTPGADDLPVGNRDTKE